MDVSQGSFGRGPGGRGSWVSLGRCPARSLKTTALPNAKRARGAGHAGVGAGPHGRGERRAGARGLGGSEPTSTRARTDCAIVGVTHALAKAKASREPSVAGVSVEQRELTLLCVALERVKIFGNWILAGWCSCRRDAALCRVWNENR